MTTATYPAASVAPFHADRDNAPIAATTTIPAPGLVSLISFLMSCGEAAYAVKGHTREVAGNSKNRRLIRRRLIQWQGGICPRCGGDDLWEDEDEGNAEFGHLIPATYYGHKNAVHAGWYYGNVSAWHASCNFNFGTTVGTIAHLARPDVIFVADSVKDLPPLA